MSDKIYDLYAEAQEAGLRMAVDGRGSVGYWTARHAARKTAMALLKAAKDAGVTDEQWEAMRKVADEIAYD
jgi:glutamate dehydrogenase/leucine dehydrogenase